MGSTFRDILRIAVPSIITNITTPLLALLDVVIVGHLGDAAFIAAIAVGGSMFNMIYWLFGFLRMGASGLTAQANGASDPRQVALVLWRGILVGLTGAALLILLRKIICAFGMTLMDIPAGAEIYAQKYFLILVWGAPAVLANYCFTGWFLGQMDAKTPMWIAFVINVSNILISLLLVYGFRMKIEGVTFGTLSAQWLGALAGVAVIAYRYRPSLKSLSGIFDARGLKGYFTVNVNIFLRRLCLIGVTVWFTRAGASQGSLILAINLLLMQFFSLFSYFMDGFAFAGESLVGNCLGSRDEKRLTLTIRALLRVGLVTALIFSIIYFIGGDILLNLMTDDQDVIRGAHEYKYWAAVIPIFGFLAFTWDGIFIGATRTREMLVSMAGATVVFFVTYYSLMPLLHNHGLWVAFIAYLGVRGIILSLYRRKISRQRSA